MYIKGDYYTDLYPFQKEGVEFLRNNRSALLADEMGIGKSVQALMAAQAVGAKTILIICPANVKYNWVKECIKWGYPPEDLHLIDSKSIKKKGMFYVEKEQGIFIVNYDLCYRKDYAKYLAKRNYDVLILDEAHFLKNHGTLRAKAVWLSGGYKDRAIYRWCLTGTPVLNRPVELHAMLKALSPESLGPYINYVDYTRRYCEGKEGNWGWDVSGHSNIDELAGRLDGFMLRRLKEDVLTELPPRIFEKVYLEMDKKTEALIYEERQEQTHAQTESIRRRLGKAKVGRCKDYISEILETQEKVVVFCYHRDVIEELNRTLSAYNPQVIHGGTPPKNRDDAVRSFISDSSSRVFLGQIEAAGVGIDGLQGVCSTVVFTEISFTPGHIMQAVDRLHRIGQDKPVNVQFLLLEGSIDEDILDKNIFKTNVITKILKDDRTVFNFDNPAKKEDIMGVENDLGRCADALEDIAKTLKFQTEWMAEVPAIPGAQTQELPPAGAPTPPEPPQKKKKATKKKAATTPPPTPPAGAPATPPNGTLSYNQLISQASKIITENAGEQAGAVFAELGGLFTARYPGYSNFAEVKEGDQQEVINFIAEFVKGKGWM